MSFCLNKRGILKINSLFEGELYPRNSALRGDMRGVHFSK